MLSAAAEAILVEYNDRLEREDAAMRAEIARGGGVALDRDTMLLAVGEEAGRFMQALAAARKAQHILEIGTSYGYSTLFLASAAKSTGGRVTTLELSARKQTYARAMMARAGLADVVDFRQGDALAEIESLAGPFDFVLLDIWKELYIPCFERFHPKLAENAIVLTDNMLFPPISRGDARAYQEVVRAKSDLETVLLPIGAGLEMSVKWSTKP